MITALGPSAHVKIKLYPPITPERVRAERRIARWRAQQLITYTRPRVKVFYQDHEGNERIGWE